MLKFDTFSRNIIFKSKSYMKHYLIVLLLCLPALMNAQSNKTTTPAPATAAQDQPPYLQFPTPPAFEYTLPDGKVITKKNLKKNVKTLIFVFSVDCDHCKHLTEEMLKNIDKFKKAQILMVTPFKRELMKEYYDHYNIKNYPNITMGSEPTRQIMYFYNLHYFPGLFVYDKKGQFVKGFEGTAKIEELAELLK